MSVVVSNLLCFELQAILSSSVQQGSSSSSLQLTGDHVTSQQQSVLLSNEQAQRIGGEKNAAIQEEWCVRSSLLCDQVSSNRGGGRVGEGGGEGGDLSHHLSMLHHYHSIRENSDRSLMMSLQALSTANEHSREEAGRRAMAFHQQFKTRVNFESKWQAGQAALQHETSVLAERKALLLERRKEQKTRQNDLYKAFTYLLLLCGIFCFFKGTLELHTPDDRTAAPATAAAAGGGGVGGGGVFWPFSHTESSIIEWTWFQIRSMNDGGPMTSLYTVLFVRLLCVCLLPDC